eukprot:gene2168-2205_t
MSGGIVDWVRVGGGGGHPLRTRVFCADDGALMLAAEQGWGPLPLNEAPRTPALVSLADLPPLQPASPLPLYAQLADRLTAVIATDRHRLDGNRLPSEADLMRQFGVSRPTVRHAMAQLAQAGLITRGRGRGTFVTPERLNHNVSLAFEDEMRTARRSVRFEVLKRDIMAPGAAMQQALKLRPDEAVERIERLRFLDDVPFAHEQRTLPASLSAGITQEMLESLAIISLLAAACERPARIRNMVRCMAGDARVTGLLGLRPRTPLMLTEHVYYAASGRPLLHGMVRFHWDRVEFTMEADVEAGPDHFGPYIAADAEPAAMKPSPFEYHAPKTLQEAVALLAACAADEGRVLAGGQTMVPAMAMRLARPGHLIDINAIPGLDRIETGEDMLHIGACVRHAALDGGALQGPLGRLIGLVQRHIAHAPIRARGTFCGSLANADASSEWCLLMVALDGCIETLSVAGVRRIDADAFFLGFMTTVLNPDEIITGATLPVLPEGTRVGFHEFARRAGDFAQVMALAAYRMRDGRITEARIAVGGVTSRARRCKAAEASLLNAVPDQDIFAAAARVASLEVKLNEDDPYLRSLAETSVLRALTAAD